MRAALLPLVAWSAAASGMTLGVNTHFEQNWPLSAFDQVGQSGAQGIRDVISWGKVEQAPGRFSFTPANSGFADIACTRGLPLLLTLTPRNPIHDAGETVFSPEGRRAFAAFVVAVADRFPCLTAIEIGNEINDHSLKGRMTRDMPGSYVAILAGLRPALKARHPQVALLCGSTLSVASGFFDKLFAAGLLLQVDGVVVHPYLASPEELPRQLDRLRGAMTRANLSRPVWASEFSFSYAAPEDAPSHGLKMITLLSAAHVARADWYALRDEPWYPNMGLYHGTTPQPALDMYRTAIGRLLAAGDAQRVETGDPLVFVYRFGNGSYVAWGAGRPISWQGPTSAWDARGLPIAPPARLSEAPVIVDAPQGFGLGPVDIVADSLLDFGGAAWRYSVVLGNGTAQTLDWIDWNWAPYLGSAQRPAYRAMANAISVGRRADGPSELVERIALPAGQKWLSACFSAKAAKPVQVSITVSGNSLFSANIAGLTRPAPLALPASADAVEIHYGATVAGQSVLNRRIRITRSSNSEPALCAPMQDKSAAGA